LFVLLKSERSCLLLYYSVGKIKLKRKIYNFMVYGRAQIREDVVEFPPKNPKFPKTGGCNKFVSGSDLCTQEKWLNGFSKKTGGPLCTLAGRKHAGLDLPHI